MKQQKFERAFEKAVSKILADNTHKAELIKQKEKISELEAQLEAAGGLHCQLEDLSEHSAQEKTL